MYATTRKHDSLAVGNRLRVLRLFLELNQNEFADRVKMTQSQIALFEAGKRYLKDLYIKVICDEFDCNEDWLIDGEGKMFKKRKLSIEEYVSIYDLSDLESDIVLDFIDMNKEKKKESLNFILREIIEKKVKVL